MIELSKLVLAGIIVGSFIIGGSLGLIITSCVAAAHDDEDDEENNFKVED